MKFFTFFFLFLLFCCEGNLNLSSFFWGFGLDGYPITKEKIDTIIAETKIKPELIVFYHQWTKKGSIPDLTASLQAIWEKGAIPCLTWEPMFKNEEIDQHIPYEEVLEGEFDSYLINVANEIKTWNKPVLIRFMHEMNLSSYHWGTSSKEFGQKSAEIFQEMYIYVFNIFKKQDVKNVWWVFCPNSESLPKAPWNEAHNYYPGDAYVDIFGMDGYNWNRDEKITKEKKLPFSSPNRSFEKIFESLYSQLKKINSNKPIIVFETASVSRTKEEVKAKWIKDAITVAKKWNIKGIVWFQVNKEEDWRINQFNDYSYLPYIIPSNPSFLKQVNYRDFE